MFDRMKRHQILVLRRAGLTLREVAQRSEVSLRTVKRVARQGQIDPPPQSPVGRPPVARALEGDATRILADRGDLPTVEILRRLRAQGYSGRKNPVNHLVLDLRRTVVPPIVRFEGVAGEFCQNDFRHVRVRYDDGSVELLHFFANRLKWSRWVHVELVPDGQVESLVRSLLNAFASFGGVPLVGVFDNPKTVVISRSGGIIQWNSTFSQAALDYRFAPELCTPRRGQEKGAVETLVGFVKNGFFKVRRFQDRADLEAQLADWHRDVNEERARLRPLPIPPSEYPLRFPVEWDRPGG
jgi:transposase